MTFQLVVGAGMVGCGLLAAYLRRRGLATAAMKPETVQRNLGTSQVKTFPWGGEPFMIKLIPQCFAIGAVAVAGALSLTTPSGPITSMELARGPVLVTLSWIWMYFNAIKTQIAVKMGGGDEQASRVAERTLYNTLEQGVPFLSLLWVCAACVDSAIASSVGLVYVLFRTFYGVAYSYYGGFSMLCELVTQPNYMVVHLLAAAALQFALGGGSLFALPWIGQNFFAWAPILFVGQGVGMMVVWDYPVSKTAAALNVAYNARKP